MITTLLLATIAAQSDGITMNFMPNGASEQGSLGMQYKLTATVDGLKKAPAGFKSPSYSIVKLSGHSYIVAVDTSEATPSSMIVDTNGDGDLTNDAAVSLSPAEFPNPNYKKFAGAFQVDLGGGKKGSVGVARLTSANAQAQGQVGTLIFVAPSYGYNLGITLDGKTFNTKIVGDPKPKARIWIDRDGDGKQSFFHEVATVGEPFNFTGTTYQIDIKDNAYVLNKPASSLPMMEMAPKLQDGNKVLSFTATTTDGKTLNFPGDFKGKVVMLDFWATWCGPCRAELPNVIKGYNANHDKGFEIVGISFDQANNGDKLAQFTKDNNMPWRQVYEGKFWDTAIGHQFDVASIPFALLVDGDTGLILSSGEEMRGEGFSNLVSGLLAKKNARHGN